MKNITQSKESAEYQNVHLLTLTGLFAALITVMTAFIAHIPTGVNGGYIHLGDSLIFLAAAILPTPYALAAAAIGGGLADLLTAPVWTAATIPIKMMITLSFSNKKSTIVNRRNVFSAILAVLITCGGYFIAELLIFGTQEAGLLAAAAASVIPNSIQGAGSAVFFVIIGSFLDKTGFYKRIG